MSWLCGNFKDLEVSNKCLIIFIFKALQCNWLTLASRVIRSESARFSRSEIHVFESHEEQKVNITWFAVQRSMRKCKARSVQTLRSARILDPGNSRRESASFFSLDHEKWFSKVSISSRNMRVTIFSLVLVSKYENGHMIISILSRQVRARKKSQSRLQKLHLLSRVRVRF